VQGTYVEFSCKKLFPVVADPIKRRRGLLKGQPSLSATLKKDRESEKKRENRLTHA
jgi:hypothetical protein